MKEAAEFAESTQILMNVSEFTDVSQATDTLISAVQAFGYTAETSMNVVDLLNTIGNNYAISTADLAQSLTKSSASLVAAGGNLAEAAALTATANAIIQDADSVGTALKTTSLRLRGTSVKVLEEEGLDSDGAIESTSKLRSQVLATSGVDILTDTGAYKSTYQILLEIAKVWDKITDDKARAGLLELLAGKRNSSVIAALLQNPEDLKAAYEDAMNAEGSALKENERYLDSIQGKIDQFNNSMQSMWSNTLNSDVVKGFVALGTEIIKIIDKIGLLKSVLIALATYSMIKNKQGPIAFFGDISKWITDSASKIKDYVANMMSMVAANTAVAQSTELTTVGSLRNAMAVAKVDVANKNAILSQLGLAGANKTQAISRDSLTASTIGAMVAEGKLTQAQANTIMSLLGIQAATNEVNAARMNEILVAAGLEKTQRAQIITQLGLSGSTKNLTKDAVLQAMTTAGLDKTQQAAILSALGLTAANTGLAASFKALWTAMWPMLAVAGAIAAIYGVVELFDSMIVTTEELEDELDGLKSELDGLESDIDAINSELETMHDRMAELIAMPSLSLVEEEELVNLKAQTAELESQLALKEDLAETTKAAYQNKAEELINSAWYSDNDWDYDASGITTDEWYTDADVTTDAVKWALEDYKEILDQLKRNDYANEKVKKLALLQKDAVAAGINKVLAKQAEYIDEYDLHYGMSDKIDAYLDEVYSYQQQLSLLQGKINTSKAVKNLLNNNTSEDITELKEKVDEVKNDSSLDAAQKQKKISKIVNKALDSNSESYERLKQSMEALGVTSDHVVRYFANVSKQADSSTVEGITAQYQHGVEAFRKMKEWFDKEREIIESGEVHFENPNPQPLLKKYKDAITDKTDNIRFDDLFDDDGNIIQDQVAKLFDDGADETVRNEFTRLAQAVEDGKITFEQAMNSFSASGIVASWQLVEAQVSELNTDVFKDLGDDLSGVIDTVKELSSAFESVADSVKLVDQAQAEMAYSGHLSVETALQLMESTDNWNEVLEIEHGNLKLVKGAEEALIQTKLDLIKTNLETALSTVEAQLAQLDATITNADAAYTIEESTNVAVRELSGNMAYLTEIMKGYAEVASGKDVDMDDVIENAEKAKKKVEEKTNYKKNTAEKIGREELEKEKERLETMLEVVVTADTPSEFRSNYSSDEVSGGNANKEDAEKSKLEELMERFQKEMDYWENRISANQARYEQLQNEIDLLEAKGQKADASYYEEQVKLENERLSLLEQQKVAAQSYLNTLDEGSEEWWEVADVLNGLESEIDDVTASIVDLQDAIGEIDTYKFEEFNTRLDDITSKLGTIRDLIAPNGEEDWFDKQGEWTAEGVAALGTYIQELETYKSGLAEVNAEREKYSKSYAGNENYYTSLGIHSEQEYYDKVKELTEQQYDYIQSISDTEQSVVDMYESNIGAVEEYTDTLIDSYNDYIDNVKDALDAERDLYDFKKKIKNQTKDIASLERRISSLSGSTNASDIAERRRLEAELYGAREELDDTYYEHSREAQDEALEAESIAYEEAMNRFVEGLHNSLDLALADMDSFLTGVTTTVMYNADTVLKKYQDTELPLEDAITSPWEKAQSAVGQYAGDALDLMNQWTSQSGFFNTFKTTGNTALTSPWTAGTNAAKTFETSVSDVMEDIVADIETNVKKASDKLSQLYQQIKDTKQGATTATTVTPSVNAGIIAGGISAAQATYKQATTPTRQSPETRPTFKKVGTNLLNTEHTGVSIGTTTYSAEEFNSLQIEGKDGIYFPYTAHGKKDRYVKKGEGYNVTRSGSKYKVDFQSFKPVYTQYAKGTMGTKDDEWAITDESWIGEEITLAAGKHGRLRGMMKGSAVLPSDISENLVEWGKHNPDEMGSGNVINNYVNAPTNDVDVANSLTVDGKSSSTQAVHDSIRDTYELIDDTVKNIDSISQQYKPSVDEALTTPWVDASDKVEEFNATANANYDDIVNHVDENKEFLEIGLNTPYDNVAGNINDFSQHAQKASVDDVITHANEQGSALTTALSAGFNNAKIATDAFKNSGTSAINAVKDAFTNTKTGLIKALNDTTSAAQKTKQAIDNVPTNSGGSSASGTSVKAGQHYISSLGKNVTLSSNVAKWSSVATQALQKTGQYSYDNLLLLLHQMQTESSGNQNAINNWDINAKNGTPSKGLMQVIDPTFQAYAMNGYDRDIYDPLSNIIAAIRYTTSRYGSLAKGWRGSGYAKGTIGTSKDEWALTDEPKFGDELVLIPGKDGNISFVRKGTGIVPADLTKKLFELAQIPTSDLMNRNLTAIVPNITKNDFKNEFNFDSLVHVDKVDSDTLPKLEQMVDKKINDFSRALNYSIKKFAR